MNVVLTGMPACGKSTVGVVLAKALGYSFIDTDLLIQAKEKKLLCDIIAEKGNSAFIDIEEKVLLSLNCERTVIATGGSAIYGESGMLSLKKNSCIVYLCAEFNTVAKRLNNITTRGVVIPDGMNLSEVYLQRIALYEKYADVKVFTDKLSIEQCVEQIIGEYTKCQKDMKG